MAFVLSCLTTHGDDVMVRVTPPAQVWRACAAIIECFVETTDDHLASNATVL